MCLPTRILWSKRNVPVSDILLCNSDFQSCKICHFRDFERLSFLKMKMWFYHLLSFNHFLLEFSKPQFSEHSTTFPVFFGPWPNLFKMHYWQHNQNKNDFPKINEVCDVVSCWCVTFVLFSFRHPFQKANYHSFPSTEQLAARHLTGFMDDITLPPPNNLYPLPLCLI